MAVNDSDGKVGPSQSKAAATASASRVQNHTSIELNDHDDEIPGEE